VNYQVTHCLTFKYLSLSKNSKWSEIRRGLYCRCISTSLHPASRSYCYPVNFAFAKFLVQIWAWGCETSRLPHFLQNWLTDGGEVVSPTRWPSFSPSKIPRGHIAAGRIRSIEKSNDLIVNRTRDLSASTNYATACPHRNAGQNHDIHTVHLSTPHPK
jgi:hypothetical protein